MFKKKDKKENNTEKFSTRYEKMRQKDIERQEKMGMAKWVKWSNHTYAKSIGVWGIAYMLVSLLILMTLGRYFNYPYHIGLILSLVLSALMLVGMLVSFMPCIIFRLDEANNCRYYDKPEIVLKRMLRLDREKRKAYISKQAISYLIGFSLFLISSIGLIHQLYILFLQHVMYNPSFLKYVFTNPVAGEFYHIIVSTGLVPLDSIAVANIATIHVSRMFLVYLAFCYLASVFSFFMFTGKYAIEEMGALNGYTDETVAQYLESKKDILIKYSVLFTVLSLVPIIGYLLTISIQRQLWGKTIKEAANGMPV